MRAVFICGTGRCGTTITKKALSLHPEIFCFKDESRFIDFPYGIVDLFRSLTSEWTPFRADAALRNFENFVLRRKSKILYFLYKHFVSHQGKRSFFSSLSPVPYLSLDIRDYRVFTLKHLEILKQDIGAIRYKGCWPGMPGFILSPRMQISTLMDQDKVIQAMGKFLNNLFADLMQFKKAKVWVDDSIYAHLHAHQIIQLMPEVKFIHMYRDPRDVIASYQTRLWAPQEPIKAAKMYCAVMDRWNTLKRQLPQESFIEICFEDFITDHDENFRKICQFIDIPWDSRILDLDLTKNNIGRWKNDLTDQDLKEIEPFIGRYMNELSKKKPNY